MEKIEITDAQKRKLERLWMYYGNNGPKHTYGQHYFIQHILERGVWEYEWYKKDISEGCLLKVIDALGFDPEKQRETQRQ